MIASDLRHQSDRGRGRCARICTAASSRCRRVCRTRGTAPPHPRCEALRQRFAAWTGRASPASVDGFGGGGRRVGGGRVAPFLVRGCPCRDAATVLFAL